jgi:hypothetical protein
MMRLCVCVFMFCIFLVGLYTSGFAASWQCEPAFIHITIVRGFIAASVECYGDSLSQVASSLGAMRRGLS